MKSSTIKKTSILATLIFIGMGCFQMLLALGFPLGYAAWGGKYKVLPIELRLFSLIAVAIFLAATFLVLARAEIVRDFNKPKLIKYSILVLAIYFAFNTIMNLLSENIWEKLIMTPIALILSLICFVMVFGPDSD